MGRRERGGGTNLYNNVLAHQRAKFILNILVKCDTYCKKKVCTYFHRAKQNLYLLNFFAQISVKLHQFQAFLCHKHIYMYNQISEKKHYFHYLY